MSANERQVGGGHYGGGEYQHWDWVHDLRLHYLPATASKYVDRWRVKNGEADLQKAIHYLQKAEELGIQGSGQPTRFANFWRYVLARGYTMTDAVAVFYIMEGNWQGAREAIERLLSPDR